MKAVTRGPGGCYRSARPAAPCENCGAERIVAHVPLRLRGTFCGRCCPCCWPMPANSTASEKCLADSVFRPARNVFTLKTVPRAYRD